MVLIGEHARASNEQRSRHDDTADSNEQMWESFARKYRGSRNQTQQARCQKNSNLPINTEPH